MIYLVFYTVRVGRSVGRSLVLQKKMKSSILSILIIILSIGLLFNSYLSLYQTLSLIVLCLILDELVYLRTIVINKKYN